MLDLKSRKKLDDICILCNNRTVNIFLKKNQFKSISSDGNKILSNCKIFYCNTCKFFFKKNNNEYKKNLKKIYKNYKIEPEFNTETNFLNNKNIYTRSDTIIDFLKKKKLLGEKNKIKILDYGIGNGELIKKLSSRTRNIIHGYDIKVSPKLKNKKNFKTISKIKDLLKNKYDLIFMIHVIEHVTDYKKLFKIINKISKKNTILFIQTPNINNYLIDFLIYDHASHFNMNSLSRLVLKYNTGKIFFFNIINKEISAILSKKHLMNSIKIKKSVNITIQNIFERINKIFKDLKKLKVYDFLGAGNKLKLIKANIGLKNLRKVIDEDINKQNKKIFGKKVVAKDINQQNDRTPIVIIDNKKNFFRLKKKYYNRKIIHYNSQS